ncbi:GRIP and coiled-coil domain-containing protein 2 [Culex pipiens pallens]|uniref:GRIP and coiled-coil domain-containing protein 2 n=1 Tax=Culex pipiens pallens TaxID=42434 RepID=UPI001954E11C|nr:GRIP and coiled-coil domain-containing protein 2 [Culex pipiens pallens]
MDPPSSTSSEQDSGAKKASPFDNLGRDDLVKKCRGLLGIAQKAKQAKDECQEENRKLKEQLALAETQKTADKECLRAMQEVVESLTQQKLQAAMKVDELEKSLSGLRRELDGAALLREQLEKISVENEAFKRQIDRLTEENEELLGAITGMEGKLKSSEQEQQSLAQSKITLEQELEKARSESNPSGKEEKLIRKLKLYKNKVQEISAKVLLLKSDRKILLKTVKEYSEQVPKWQKELVNASSVLFAKTRQFEKENGSLKERCAQYERDLEELRGGKSNEDESKNALEVLQVQFETLQLSQQSLSDELQQALADKTRLQKQLENSRTGSEVVDSQKAINENLQKRLTEFEDDLSKNLTELTESKKQLEELHKSNSKLEARAKDYEDKIQQHVLEKDKLEESFKTQNDKHSQQIDAINLKLQQEASEKESLQKQLAELQTKTQETLQNEAVQENEFSKQLDVLEAQIEAKTEELSDCNQKLQETRNEKILLQQELGKSQKCIEALNVQLMQTQETVKAMTEDFEKRFAEAQQNQTSQQEQELLIQKRLDELQQLYQSQVSELQAANVHFSEMSSKAAASEVLDEHNRKLRETIAERDTELTTMRKSLEETSDALQSLQVQHQELAQQGTTTREELGSLQSKFELVKLENSELLSELKEINEILKERGGVISLQVSKISELEAAKGTLQQKFTERELRIGELERTVTERDLELNALRDRNIDTQSDVMSTSTISRADESARMRDVDDSFEEKYIKLRALAVKLKKKVAEQTIQLQRYEKEGLGKNLQSLQAENDKLLDQLEGERKNVEQLKQDIETLNQLRTEVDSSKKDKSSLESSIREYREQVQSLKREKEAFNMAKKEIDAENQKLKVALKAKEKQLTDELEAQKELKAEVERSRLAAKKANVLNLEMEAYEKSLAELNKKLEAKKDQVKELESTMEVQEGTIKSLKSQIALLDQSLASERSHSQELKKNVDVQQEKLRLSEHQRGETNVELAQLKMDYEKMKMEIESNRVELSEAISEKEKVSSGLETEKSRLMKQVYSLESTVDELKVQLKDREQETEDVKAEFASYKIRAQSVLRQNQSKDSGKEVELQEEVQNLQKALDVTQTKLQNASQQMAELTKSCEELRFDKTRLQSRSKELHDLLEESRLQHESLLEESRQMNLNHQEALKTQRLQNETLVNCYKKQLDELQEKHSLELSALQSRIGHTGRDHPENNNHIPSQHSSRISDEQKINLLLMEREEGEGSESTSSQNTAVATARRKVSTSSQPRAANRSTRDLIPLDELLNSSFDDTASVFGDPADDSSVRAISPGLELQQTKEQLGKQESRVRHLTALLAEAEQDLAKLNQLNELLKEEVRRQERSIEREKHAHNSEYLKNVIFKFLTLNSGDEKSRLVPVLNTILRLSPDETQKLNNVAKGSEGGVRGWTGILWN